MSKKSAVLIELSYTLPMQYGGDEMMRSIDPASRAARNLNASCFLISIRGFEGDSVGLLRTSCHSRKERDFVCISGWLGYQKLGGPQNIT